MATKEAPEHTPTMDTPNSIATQRTAPSECNPEEKKKMQRPISISHLPFFPWKDYVYSLKFSTQLNSELVTCPRDWGDWQEISPPPNCLLLPNSRFLVSPWKRFAHLLVWSPIFCNCGTEDTALDRLALVPSASCICRFNMNLQNKEIVPNWLCFWSWSRHKWGTSPERGKFAYFKTFGLR